MSFLDYVAGKKVKEEENIQKSFDQYFLAGDNIISSLKALHTLSSGDGGAEEIAAKRDVVLAEMKRLSRWNDFIHMELERAQCYSSEIENTYKEVVTQMYVLAKDFEKETDTFKDLKEGAMQKFEKGVMQVKEKIKNVTFKPSYFRFSARVHRFFGF